MNRAVQYIFLTSLIAACNTSPNTSDNASVEINNSDSFKTTVVDTTPKVTAVGGIFFFSDDPKATRDWYAKNLGLEMNDWGSAGFESRDVNHPDVINSFQWKPFKNGSDYFTPSKKDFMINYQVQNIEALISRLKANGVTIVDSLETYDYGKFIHIMDADGNKLELWEPVDSTNNP